MVTGHSSRIARSQKDYPVNPIFVPLVTPQRVERVQQRAGIAFWNSAVIDKDDAAMRGASTRHKREQWHNRTHVARYQRTTLSICFGHDFCVVMREIDAILPCLQAHNVDRGIPRADLHSILFGEVLVEQQSQRAHQLWGVGQRNIDNANLGQQMTHLLYIEGIVLAQSYVDLLRIRRGIVERGLNACRLPTQIGCG